MQHYHPLMELFNNGTLNYDNKMYPLSEIILECVQNHYPDVKSLDTIHESMDTNELFELGHKVNRELYDTDFYKMLDHIIGDYIQQATGEEVLIQRFPSIRFLQPNQDEQGKLLAFHQGRWVGKGLGLYTIWMPFTDCYESNSLQILDLEPSREITRKSVLEQWDYEKLNEECIKHCWPVTLQPGQAHLFGQEHIHGNIPNRTGKTRCSLDVNILVKGGQPSRKWPGSYFRPLHKDFAKKPEFKQGENIVTYAEYEGIKTKKLDLYFQTLVVKGYCQKAGIPFPYQHGDNESLGNHYLEYLLKDDTIDHILLTSMFSLPDDAEKRIRIMKKAVTQNCKLHLCNEDIIVESQEDIDNVEYLRTFTDDWSSPVDQLEQELFGK